MHGSRIFTVAATLQTPAVALSLVFIVIAGSKLRKHRLDLSKDSDISSHNPSTEPILRKMSYSRLLFLRRALRFSALCNPVSIYPPARAHVPHFRSLAVTALHLQHLSHTDFNDPPWNLDFDKMTMESDEFNLSSSDEAEMAALASAAELTLAANRKRPASEAPLLSSKKAKPPAREYPRTSSLARRIVKETWGYSEFRLRQEEVISRLIHGGSAVVVFPTGGGKSLIYQVPALAFDEVDEVDGSARGGLTLVVTPLIALMKVCPLGGCWGALLIG